MYDIHPIPVYADGSKCADFSLITIAYRLDKATEIVENE